MEACDSRAPRGTPPQPRGGLFSMVTHHEPLTTPYIRLVSNASFAPSLSTSCTSSSASTVLRSPPLSLWRKWCRDAMVDRMGLEYVLNSSISAKAIPPSSSASSSSSAPLGIEGCLFCIKWNQDATKVAATAAESIEVWDCSGGSMAPPRLQCRLRDGHSEVVTYLTWCNGSASGSISSEASDSNALSVGDFFSCSLDKTIKLWRRGRVAHSFEDHKDWLRCLALTVDDTTLLSGCVSSFIYGWDVATGRVLFKLPDAHSTKNLTELNTINSLHFMHSDINAFFSGARDGVIKMWDRRDLKQLKPVASIPAHSAKVNSISISADDRFLLSSGRDSAVYLWDIRRLSSKAVNGAASGSLQGYTQHVCEGYNISATFLNHDRHVASGSEDGYVYIYERDSGAITKKVPCHSVVHLVHAVDNEPLRLLSSCIDQPEVYLWSPQHDSQEENILTKNTSDNGEPAFLRNHRTAVESVMRKYGEQMLKVFHDHNFTFSNNMSWGTLIEQVGEDNPSADLLNMVNEMANDFARMLDLYRMVEQPEGQSDEEDEAAENDDASSIAQSSRQIHEAEEEERMATHDSRRGNVDGWQTEFDPLVDADLEEDEDVDRTEEEDEEEEEDEDEEETVNDGINRLSSNSRQALRRLVRRLMQPVGPSAWDNMHRTLQERQAVRERRYEERLRERQAALERQEQTSDIASDEKGEGEDTPPRSQ